MTRQFPCSVRYDAVRSRPRRRDVWISRSLRLLGGVRLPGVNRRVDERDPSGGARLATRLGLASIGSRPPAVAVLVVALLVAGTVVASVVGTLSLARGSGPAPPLGSAAAPPEL